MQEIYNSSQESRLIPVSFEGNRYNMKGTSVISFLAGANMFLKMTMSGWAEIPLIRIRNAPANNL